MSKITDMTGFARVSGQHGTAQWTWEARSVNGKGLDVRLRIPSDMSGLDGPVRKLFSQKFIRGNIQVSLNLQHANAASHYTINQDLFDTLVEFTKAQGTPAVPGQLLQVPGVVSEARDSLAQDDRKALERALIENAKVLVDALKSHRDQEGEALAPVLSDALAKIENLTSKAGEIGASQPAMIKARVQAKLTELLGDDIPADRLAQEAAMLAMKADIREEIDRLKAHCEQARGLLEGGSPVGRKLDFLCQEFNRETNTLCSKSSDIDLTQIGLDLKSVVEQFREQAANVE